MRKTCLTLSTLILGLAAIAQSQPTLSTTAGLQQRIGSHSITPNGGEWDISGVVDYDNSDSSSYHAWWGFTLDNLGDVNGETLNFSLTGSSFSSDFILPVYSFDDGVTFHRVPDSGGNGPFEFTIDTPPGVSSVRVSKYYPYTMPQYAAFQASINTNPHVTEEESTETTTLGNKLYMYEITDTSVSSVGKKRVWIHSAVHPAENTAHFTTEGLINFLLSGDSEAEIILDHIIFNIVPVANPDGVELGNYRTNADSVNLEVEWSAPYSSTVPEIVFLRRKIREYMGTSGSPGANPIEMLFNLHSTHGSGTYPFHFVHNATWNYPGDFGVRSDVRALEDQWISSYRARSHFIDLGSNSSSNLGGSGRPYVEGFMHDEYSVQPSWNPVMAITIEGGYMRGPISGVNNTPDDYRQMGMEMGLALADYFAIDLTTKIGDWWVLH